PPCRQLTPVMESLAKEYRGRIRFVKVNVDKGSALARKYGVRSIPTVILFSRGRPAYRWTGFNPASHFRPIFDSAAEENPSGG
ncbi:hypothetical protein LCGC14_2919630, partial [marine sediment metagenome]